MDYTKSIGSIVELQCISKFIEMGFDCSIPYGDACKYDFIADVDGELLRIQCKSAINPLKNGKRDTEAFTINCTSQTTNTQKTTRHTYSDIDIDYFATYFLGEVYIIPVEECSTSKTLRFSPPNNGQMNYNKANDYLIQNMFGHKQDSIFLIKEQEKKDKLKHIQRQVFKCAQCGIIEVYIEGGICHKCNIFNMRKVERPSREELKSLIRSESFLEIGRKFNVSDNAIRKWCKNYNLPSKKSEIKTYSDVDWKEI